MNRVELNKEEAEWFSRNVLKMIKLLEAQEKQDPKILTRSTYRILNSLRAQAESWNKATETQNVFMNRKQRQIVRELILSVNKTLTDRIIPEYELRGGHEKYVVMGKDKAKKLHAMARKLR